MRRNFWFLTVTLVLIVGTFVATLLSDNRRCSASTCRAASRSCSRRSARSRTRRRSTRPSTSSAAASTRSASPSRRSAARARNVIIDLPGVRDRDKARRLVGKTAELRFRPVLALRGARDDARRPPPRRRPKTSTTTAAARRRRRRAPPRRPRRPRRTEVKTSTAGRGQGERDRRSSRAARPATRPPLRYQLGPAALTGKGVSGAKAEFLGGQGWVVNLSLKDDGSDRVQQARRTSRSRSSRRRTRSRSCSTASCSPRPRSSRRASRAVTSRSRATSARATPRTSRPCCSTARCRSQLKELTTQSVSPTLGTDQLRGRHRGRDHRARAGRALHARLLPAARRWS